SGRGGNREDPVFRLPDSRNRQFHCQHGAEIEVHMQKSKGFVSAVMLVVTMAMVACASTRTQKSAGEQIDDSVTTGRVKAALIADPVTKAHQIDVEVFKGTVQLNGFVDSAASKERATEVAKATKGV